MIVIRTVTRKLELETARLGRDESRGEPSRQGGAR